MLQDTLHVALAFAALVGGGGCGSRATPSPADAAMGTGVPCAGVECEPTVDQFCDTADYGVTGTCRAHVAPTNQSFGCDGPEDCIVQGVFGVCCMIERLGSACSSAGCGSSGALFMCHTEADCATGERCCTLAATTGYAVCRERC